MPGYWRTNQHRRIILLLFGLLCIHSSISLAVVPLRKTPGGTRGRRPQIRTRLAMQENSRRSLRIPQNPLSTFRLANGSDQLNKLIETIEQLQRQDLPIRLVKDTQIAGTDQTKLRRINAIVFCLCEASAQNLGNASSAYILAVLDAKDRVNTTKLEQAVVQATSLVDGDERRTLISLAPINQLVALCGFESGTVPPLGLTPAPLLTIVENSLLDSSDDDDDELLVGGGGQPGQSVLIRIETLVNYGQSIHVANFRENQKIDRKLVKNDESVSLLPMGILSGHSNERYQKPYFAVAPPDNNIAQGIVNGNQEQTSLEPEWICVVGRISGVRQMARRLVFCDLAPPLSRSLTDDDQENDIIHPWRNPRNDKAMAVQLILGKTICQRWGVEQAELAFRRLKVGQLVMIQGKTNVGNRDSLKNWISKSSLDVVVFDLEWLQTESGDTRVLTQNGSGRTARPETKMNGAPYNPPEGSLSNLPFLQLQDMYPDTTLEQAVHLVQDLSGIQDFYMDLATWLETYPDQVGLVGMDCEWKPTFLATENEPQPVLLLQICLHDLQKIYLMDLQTLARPILHKCNELTEMEQALAKAIALLYQTPRLVKLGFQVHNDLQRLAASYPHISAFDQVYSVLEISKLGTKVLQLAAKQEGMTARDRATVTSSLIKMTERFVQRTLNKSEQVSDWSLRPLTRAQLEYAALDAVVTPFMAEALVAQVGARFTGTSTTVNLGRWEKDGLFQELLTSWRFLLLDPTTEPLAIQRWNGKCVLGNDSYQVVSQSWTTGSEPQLPTIPTASTWDENVPFVDLNGIRQIPSHTLLADASKLDALVGTWTSTKLKEQCVLDLLKVTDAAADNDTGTENVPRLLLERPPSTNSNRLHFHARSGFIELLNAVVLFVNLPLHNAGKMQQSRSYPNEWLEDGSILTWFVKHYDWKDGTTRLAQKMMDSESYVVLYVRRGKGTFFNCGRCRVVTLPRDDRGRHPIQESQQQESDQWSILKFYLLLQDFGRLQELQDFRNLVNPSRQEWRG